MNYLTKTTLVALAGASFFSTSARAQNAQTNYAPGDLLLGFRQTAGSNTSNDLLADLGSVTTFDSLATLHAGAVINVNTGSFVSGGSGASGINGIGNLGADLISLWGANWFSVTDSSQTSWNFGNRSVLFGVVGTNGSTVYAGNTSAVPYTPSSTGAQNGVKAKVDALGGNSYDFNQSTGNSNFNIIESGTGVTTSWQGNLFRINNNTTNFNLYPTSFESPQGIVLNLDREIAGAANGTQLGFFSLDTSGNLLYTVASAVPEPTTGALMILGGAFVVFVIAKRRVASAKSKG